MAPSGGSLLSGVWGSGVLGFSFFFSILVLGSLLLVFLNSRVLYFSSWSLGFSCFYDSMVLGFLGSRSLRLSGCLFLGFYSFESFHGRIVCHKGKGERDSAKELGGMKD